MITNVMMIGQIDEVIADNVRYVNVERYYRDENNQFIVDKIPVVYWTRATNNFFMTMKKGTLICVKGRLEVNEDIGLLIVCDYLEMLDAGPKTT
jgi:single-stranded DNA-binding protein